MGWSYLNSSGSATFAVAGGVITPGTTVTAQYQGDVNDGTSTGSFTLPEAPSFTSPGSATFTVGTNDSFAFATTGYPAPTYTESGPLPGGVTFNAAMGTISGNASVGADGVYNDTITATNSTSFATQAFTLDVKTAVITTFTDQGPAPSLLGQSVMFNVAVSGGNAVPTGTVMLEDASNGNATVGSSTISNGSATIAVSSLTVGAHNLFAVYGGDTTHAASQSPQIAQVVNTITSSVDALPATESSNSFNVFWSGTDAAPGNPTITFTIMVSDNFAPFTTFVTTTATSAVFTGQNGHTYSFFSLASDNLGNTQTVPTGTATTTVHSVPVTTLVVTSFTPTATGFSATFSKPFLNTGNNPIHLYSANASNATYGPADVTLVGRNTGPVTGSLIVNSTNTGFTFIKTDLAGGGGTAGLLAPDSYVVTFLSGSLAFQDVNGNLLDGNNSGVGGTNYTNSFTVTALAANAVTVSIPDFARGPDSNSADSINLMFNAPNPLTGGIPVTLNIPAERRGDRLPLSPCSTTPVNWGVPRPECRSRV